VTQQARQLAWTFPERADPIRFLIRDRDNNSGRVSMLSCCPPRSALCWCQWARWSSQSTHSFCAALIC